MFSRFQTWCLVLLAAVVLLPCGRTAKAGDVIDLDLTNVDPSVREVFQRAEQFWESRLKGYSSEIPQILLRQLSALTISANVASIDGEGGILGFAGPDGTLSYWSLASGRAYTIAVTASMTFDLDDFPSMEADGILEDVIIHEMGHALGFGTLWGTDGTFDDGSGETYRFNQLIGQIAGIGEVGYLGRYGVTGYARDIGNLSVTFVPLEQRGGPGTALGHWADLPPFFNQITGTPPRKEIMTGFACDADPNFPAGTGPLFCAPKFIANATLGAMADLGFAVDGFNGQFATPRGVGRDDPWPKYTGGPGPIINFGNDPANAGLRFNLSRRFAVTREAIGSVGSEEDPTPQTVKKKDPYNLRGGSWK